MKTISLELVEFAIVTAQRRRNRDFSASEPNWIRQVQNIRISDVCWREKHGVLGAKLLIDHGLGFGFPTLWDSHWRQDHNTLCKSCKGNKEVLLQMKVSIDDRGNLHNDNDFAFVSGEMTLWFLHGIHVEDPKWMTTEPETWTPQEVLAVRNVDLRRELIRRKGIEQLLEGLYHRVLDTDDNYSLVSVMLGENTASACNFLKMLNPSIGIWHMEGVPNNLRTVRDALLWRNKGWFVHADVLT